MYFLVDCNQFFVSCELLFHPHLKKKPVIVLSNNDGCVISRSPEAKALGIPMGAPYYQCASIIKEKNIAVFSSNFALYGDISRRVMEVLHSFTADMEEYSIDEAFLILTQSDPLAYADQIKKKVLQWTGIPISVGIGKTKTLAKLANDIAKKEASLKGLFYFEDEKAVEKKLSCLPVSEIWGIGKRLAAFLNAEGITTALAFKNAPDEWIKKNLSVTGLKCAWELRGISCFNWEECPAEPKSITYSRSFGRDVLDLQDLNEAAASYVAKACEKLRSQQLVASFLSIFLMTSRFCSNTYENAASFSLAEPSDYTPLLIHHAKEILRTLYRPGYVYKKVGITLSGLVSTSSYQQDLFAEPLFQREKKIKAMRVIDDLKHNSSFSVLRFASEGLQQSWKRKQEKRSDRFTTRWDELLTISI